MTEGCARCGGPCKVARSSGRTFKFCSPECTRAHHLKLHHTRVKVEKRRWTKHPRPCVVCGKMIPQPETSGAPRKTCSLDCLNEQARRWRASPKGKALMNKTNAKTKELKTAGLDPYKESRKARRHTDEYRTKRNAARKERRLNDPEYREFENRRQHIKGNPEALRALRDEFNQRKLAAAGMRIAATLETEIRS